MIEDISDTLKDITDYVLKIKSLDIKEWESKIPNKLLGFINENSLSKKLDKKNFPTPLNESYIRIPVDYEKTKPWELMIAIWNPNKLSPIHGHPSFIFYYILSGEIEMELYDKNLNFIKKIIMKNKDYIHYIGEEGTFNNFIHRIIPKVKTITLHLYSSSSLQGEVYKK